MSFFGGLADVVSHIGQSICNAAGLVKERITDPLGMGNLGKNVPTSFSIYHNIDVSGKVNVSVNVQGSVDVNVNLKDLIGAAAILRDALTNFDIFGGALRQLIGSFQQLSDIKTLLLELRNIVGATASDHKADYYYLELSLVNESTVLANNGLTNDMRLFQVQQDCACASAITINKKEIAENFEMGITASSAMTSSPVRVEEVLPLENLVADNELQMAVLAPFADSDLEAARKLQSNAKLQIKLIHATMHWKYTVAEYIKSGHSSINSNVLLHFVDGRSRTACGAQSERSRQITGQIDKLLSALSVPNLPSSPGEPVATITDLLQNTLMASYRARVSSADELELILRSSEENARGLIDARELVTVAISCAKGEFNVTMSFTVQDGGKPTEQTVFVDDTVLASGDELAVRLPLDIDLVLQKNIEQNIQVKVEAITLDQT